MPRLSEPLNMYITTYRVDGSCEIHWALSVAPRYEHSSLPSPVSMTYRVICENGRRCYQQFPTIAFPEKDILGRIFVGRVEQSHQRTVEQLLADPRHYAAQDGSSKYWVRAVLKVLAESRILKDGFELDVAQTICVMTAFSEEIWRKIQPRTDELGMIPTIKYPGL